MGAGTGTESPDNAPVSFSWKSKDGGTTGTMTATLPDGERFSGPYLQLTSEVRSDDFAPMWSGWHHGWYDWDGGWGGYPGMATVYSGRSMANLQGPDGQRMRCRFYLNDPLAGMSGGGQGQCQLSSGRRIDAVFPHT